MKDVITEMMDSSNQAVGKKTRIVYFVTITASSSGQIRISVWEASENPTNRKLPLAKVCEIRGKLVEWVFGSQETIEKPNCSIAFPFPHSSWNIAMKYFRRISACFVSVATWLIPQKCWNTFMAGHLSITDKTSSSYYRLNSPIISELNILSFPSV